MESHEINKYFKKIVRYGGGADAKKTETALRKTAPPQTHKKRKTNLSRPAVSHHLQIMKDAGIVPKHLLDKPQSQIDFVRFLE